MSETQTTPKHYISFTEKTYVILLCFFSGCTDIKLGDIQCIEMMLIITFFYFLIKFFSYKNFTFKVEKHIWKLSKIYFVFIILILFLAIINLNQEFFIPGFTNNFLKNPFWISLVRILQLSLMISSYLILATYSSRDTQRIYFLTKTYIVIGTIYSIYSIVSYLALNAGVKLGGAYETGFGIRACGLFNEGGPFGLYMVSVVLLTCFLKFYFKSISSVKFLFILTFQLTSLFLSTSKAGFIALVLLTLTLTPAMMKKKYFINFGIFTTLLLLLVIKSYSNQLMGYLASYSVSTLSENTTEDNNPNVIMGRIAAAHILPNIIKDKPILGIGIGNYSLVRNNPLYLEGLPTVDEWDLPGLGLIGNIAEFGIPLSILFIYLLSKPLFLAHKQKKNIPLLVPVCSFQLISYILGVQITFFYPWFISAIATGLIIENIVNNNDIEQNKIIYQNYLR